MTLGIAITELQRYVVEDYRGNLELALESIGGIRRVRAVLGWETNLAAIDPRMYFAPGMWPEQVRNAVEWQQEREKTANL